MSKSKHLFLLSLIFSSFIMVSACQSPTMNAPQITNEERAAEEARQQQVVDEAHARGGVPKLWKSRTGITKQFESVAERIEKAGAEICADMGKQYNKGGCYYYFEMDKSREVNAYADGERIVVANGMMRFIQNDEELALVMSHEFAHNLLGHPDAARTNALAGSLIGSLMDAVVASQGMDTGGAFSQVGGSAGVLHYSKAFESEADYVGLYIMARAGYRIQDAPNFWRRFSVNDPDNMYGGQTHPSNPERSVALQKTQAEINYKREHRLPLLPDAKPQG